MASTDESTSLVPDGARKAYDGLDTEASKSFHDKRHNSWDASDGRWDAQAFDLWWVRWGEFLSGYVSPNIPLVWVDLKPLIFG